MDLKGEPVPLGKAESRERCHEGRRGPDWILAAGEAPVVLRTTQFSHLSLRRIQGICLAQELIKATTGIMLGLEVTLGNVLAVDA